MGIKFGVLLGKCCPFFTRLTAIHASHSGFSHLDVSPGADPLAGQWPGASLVGSLNDAVAHVGGFEKIFFMRSL